MNYPVFALLPPVFNVFSLYDDHGISSLNLFKSVRESAMKSISLSTDAIQQK